MPVVTATWPRRLNHPVIHAANGAPFSVESLADQKYGPPEVGLDDEIRRSGQDPETEIPQQIVT